MRIISGFKDYYDYLVSQNVDNKVIYDRHCQEFRYGPDGPYTLMGNHDPDVAGYFHLSRRL